MHYVVLLVFILLTVFDSHQQVPVDPPILVASPYPFNSSESSRIECFSNEQGPIQSITLIANMVNASALKSSAANLENNGSIFLIIAAPFNYSALESPIKCTAKYDLLQSQTTELDVLSVANIDQDAHLTVQIYAKQTAEIYCRTYGTDVEIYWDFAMDLSKNESFPLPKDIRIVHRHTTNDTLLIEHVREFDHQGYYRCHATNKLLGHTYQAQRTIQLIIKKNDKWILILIICILTAVAIATLVLGSKYYQYKKKQRLKALEQRETENLSEQQSLHRQSEEKSDDHEESTKERITEQENIDPPPHINHRIQSFLQLSPVQEESSFVSPSNRPTRAPQFILGNPYADEYAHPLPFSGTHIHSGE